MKASVYAKALSYALLYLILRITCSVGTADIIFSVLHIRMLKTPRGSKTCPRSPNLLGKGSTRIKGRGMFPHSLGWVHEPQCSLTREKGQGVKPPPPCTLFPLPLIAPMVWDSSQRQEVASALQSRKGNRRGQSNSPIKCSWVRSRGGAELSSGTCRGGMAFLGCALLGAEC